jgi:RNA-directed DNA polymerase
VVCGHPAEPVNACPCGIVIFLEAPNQSLEDLARLVNPSVSGWVNYYGRFYRSALTPVLRHLERALIRWACRKYKRFRGHVTNAAHWLGRVARRDPNLLVLWQIGIRPATGS